MSIQSTIYINRKEAESKWVDKMLENMRKDYELLARSISKEQIEMEIEEEFYNYEIEQERNE